MKTFFARTRGIERGVPDLLRGIHPIQRFIPLCSISFALLLLPACNWVHGFFAEKKEPFDPCDPYYDYYEKGKHFIHDEMIQEDGTIDYRRIFKGLDPGYTRCDPLARPGQAPKSLKEQSKPTEQK